MAAVFGLIDTFFAAGVVSTIFSVAAVSAISPVAASIVAAVPSKSSAPLLD